MPRPYHRPHSNTWWLKRRPYFVFMMREWLELETDEICQELEITATNAWALLYRARMRLRECLDLHWFGNQPAAA